MDQPDKADDGKSADQNNSKPTLLEMMLGGREKFPDPTDDVQPPQKSLEDMISSAADEPATKQKEPKKSGGSLKEMIAQALAEVDEKPSEGDIQAPAPDTGVDQSPQPDETEKVVEKTAEKPVKKTPPEQPKVNIVQGPSLIARYGKMKMLGQFRHDLLSLPRPGTKIIVKTSRGVELAEVVTCVGDEERFGCITYENLVGYISQNGLNYPLKCEGKVLRIANSRDMTDIERIEKSATDEMLFCRKCIDELKLKMKTVSVDHLFGNDRIIFYFMSASRVDFRQLVQKLSSKFHARVEMRQVGSRDEAKLVADYEKCGQQCCCQGFLKELKPVSMRMAKMQKASMDPAKISGRCGRLMCCMRYEDETYEELRGKLPKKKTWVRTDVGVFQVMDTQIITQLVRVSMSGGSIETIPNERILEYDVDSPKDTSSAVKPRVSAKPVKEQQSPQPTQPDSSPQPQPQPQNKNEGTKKRRRPRRKRRKN